MKAITLRPYQKQAIDKIIWAQKLEGNDIVVLPTGAGKSIIIAEIASRLNKDILILQPTKEILEQNYKKLNRYVDKEEIGIYSSSMNSRDIKKYTLATIGSIYKIPELFKHFQTIIIDECHLVNPKNLEGMFTQFLKDIGSPKVIGLTATPYRLSSMYKQNERAWYSGGWEQVTTTKLINRLKERFWNRIVFNISIKELMDLGYLCPVEYKYVKLFEENSLKANKSGSDFDMEFFENEFLCENKKVIDTIKIIEKDFKSLLIFCPGVEYAEKLAKEIPGAIAVSSKTGKKEREKIISDFKSGKIKTICNVGVLTTGFDHPSLDCIIMLRPTQSIALYTQMLGRGIRIADKKSHCTIIDMSGNVWRIGKLETIRVEKIDGKWEIISEKGSWHNKELYSYYIKK